MLLSYLKKYTSQIEFDHLHPILVERNKLPSAVSAKPFHNCLDRLPDYQTNHVDFSKDILEIGKAAELSSGQIEDITKALTILMPWRKGPYNLFGIGIDGEWRCEYKWERIKNFLPPLKGKRILDIGCNNGWYLFKMSTEHPELLLGIDPVARCYYQFKLLKHFINTPNLFFELLGIDEVRYFHHFFDVIFNMGIIYHHRSPIDQLLDIRQALRPGGTTIIETLGIPGDEPVALFPYERYTQMKNVYFIPTVNCLVNWLKKTKFENIELISSVKLTHEEQRVTKWCPSKSLEDFLDPTDDSKTIEGHPAPIRFAVRASRPLKEDN